MDWQAPGFLSDTGAYPLLSPFSRSLVHSLLLNHSLTLHLLSLINADGQHGLTPNYLNLMVPLLPLEGLLAFLFPLPSLSSSFSSLFFPLLLILFYLLGQRCCCWSPWQAYLGTYHIHHRAFPPTSSLSRHFFKFQIDDIYSHLSFLFLIIVFYTCFSNFMCVEEITGIRMDCS